MSWESLPSIFSLFTRASALGKKVQNVRSNRKIKNNSSSNLGSSNLVHLEVISAMALITS
jgi:hypothetical protein